MWMRLVGFRAVCESCSGARSLHNHRHHHHQLSLSLYLGIDWSMLTTIQTNHHASGPSGADQRPNERTAGVMRTFQLINNRQELAFVRRFLRYLFANRWLMMGFMLPFSAGSGAGRRRKEAIRCNPASDFDGTERRNWVLRCLKLRAFLEWK